MNHFSSSRCEQQDENIERSLALKQIFNLWNLINRNHVSSQNSCPIPRRWITRKEKKNDLTLGMFEYLTVRQIFWEFLFCFRPSVIALLLLFLALHFSSRTHSSEKFVLIARPIFIFSCSSMFILVNLRTFRINNTLRRMRSHTQFV